MALTKIPSSLLDTSGGFDLQGNITLGDNEQIQLGDSGDLAIYHDGSHSYIKDTGTGNLFIDATSLRLRTGAGTENYLVAEGNGAVTLYHDNSPKIATSSTGATVTGNLAVTGDLDITGNVNSYNVTDLDVTDQTITLGAGQTEANSGGSGIIIDGSNASILWDETNDTFDINKGLTALSNVGIGTTSPDSRLHVVAGTNALRTITMGDTSGNNVGIQAAISLGNPRLAFLTAGSEAMRIDENQNVGIGTTSPQTELEISAAQSPFLRLTSEKNGTHDAGDIYGELQFYTQETYGNAPVVAAKIQSLHTRAGTGHDNADAGLAFFTSTASSDATATERMRIESATGKVGIGTSSPSTDLHVVKASTTLPTIAADTVGILESNGTAALSIISGTGNSVIRFGDSAEENIGQIRYVHASDKLDFTINTNIAMTIDSSGNVGIGTTPYANSLSSGIDSVNGLGLFGYNDGFYVSGNAYYNGAWKYKTSGFASKINSNSTGDVIISGAVSGSADGTITWADNVTIKKSGNVGIGTISPTTKLDILDANSINLRFGDIASTPSSQTAGYIGMSTSAYSGHNGDLVLIPRTSATSRILLMEGNVGIGTTSPSATLDVNGTIALNGVQSFIPKAWVRFNEDAPTITASGNVSSITETVAGSYIANFTTSLADTDYTTVASMKNAGGSNVLTVGARSFNTSSTGIQISGDGGLDASRTQNEILYSEQFDNAAWTKSSSSITANSQTAPDSTTTADTLTNFATGNNRIYQGITTVAGQRYTTSVHVKKGNNANTSLSALTSGFSSLGGIGYNFDTDTVTGGTLGQNCTRELLSNGWVRLSFSFTATTTSSLVCWVRAGTGNGEANATVHLWGCQHEKGDFVPSTYKQTTSAAVNLDFEDISLVVIN